MIALLDKISEPTRQLSDYIADALARPLPGAVVERARHHILDTFAAMVSGSQLRPGRMAIDYAASLGGVPEASVIGTELLTSATNAALANGMLAHADETDDLHAPSRTHPGCAVIPAALAAAERSHASGERFLRAVVLGYDVAARVNHAMGAEALAAVSRSTHSVGGVFGAGAAAGALLGLDAAQVRHLLSYCAQQASGVGCNVRDSEHIEKAFDFGGMPARNGVAAATMVAHGFTGVDDVFAGERNFLDAYAPEPDPGRLCKGLGEHFEILATNIKKWSVGSPAQSALDALTCLMESEHPAPAEIATIRVHLPARSARTVDNAPMPDVNVQHLMAMLLVDGRLTFHTVHDHARMQDAAVLAMRGRIELVPSQELMEASPPRQAIVEIALRNGRRMTHRTVAVRGTADNPMTRAEVEAKALDLMREVLGSTRAGELVTVCRSIERTPDMTAFRQFWQCPGGTGKSGLMLLLSNDDVEAVLDVKSCIAVMEEAYRELGEGRGASGGRSEILTPTKRDDGLYSLLTMSGVAPKFGVGAVRINSDILTWPRTPAGFKRVKVPSAPGGRYAGLVLLFSVDTGEPLAIYPDGVVQRLRVAATCGLAAQHLARADARVAGLLGTGWQAGGQAAAIAAVRPIERIHCFSPDAEHRQAFAREMSRRLGIDIIAVATAREAVVGADVVMCATSSMQPVLSAEWITPGTHVSSLKRLELDASVAARADIVVTHVRKSSAQIVRTAGAELARDTELEKAALSKALKQDELPDLADLVLNRTGGRRSERDITLFLNYMGLGYQFAATGHVIWQRARERGIGRQLDTDWFTSEVPS